MRIAVWYNTLSSGSQTLTWVLMGLCGIGVLRLVWLNLRYWFLDIIFINHYLGKVNSFAQKFRNNGNNAEECAYILRMSNKATTVFGYDRFDYPEIDIAAGIKYRKLYSDEKVNSMVDLLHAVCLEWDQKRKNKRWSYFVQLIIPVLFWLFRGIEAVMLLVAYMLKELGLEVKDEVRKSRIIRIIGVIFTFITGMASLLSYLKIDLW